MMLIKRAQTGLFIAALTATCVAHAAAQIDCGVGAEHAFAFPEPVNPASLVEDGRIIDVLMLYSPTARGNRTHDEVVTALRGGIANATFRLATSGVDLRLRLVHAHEVDFIEGPNDTIGQALAWLAPNTGVVEQLTDIRDAVGADLVGAYFTNLDGAGGVANMMTNLSPDFEAVAFHVVKTTGVIPHEIGHNLGLNHFYTGPNVDALYPYSFGWQYNVGGTTKSTIMYNHSPRYSNPLLLDSGVPTGNPMVADAARSITEAKQVVANFRPIFLPDRYSMSLESRGSFGIQGNGASAATSVSADGRWVAFSTLASNLSPTLPGDSNGLADIYVRDRDSGVTTRVSVGTNGQQTNGHSFQPAISADGRYVAFESLASNLVPGDTNNSRDIFRYDRLTGATMRVSMASGVIQSDGDSFGADISDDGSEISFESDATNLDPIDGNGVRDVFVRDIGTSVTKLVSRTSAGVAGDGPSSAAAISGDGVHVAFHSMATNLGENQHVPNVKDVFAHDRSSGTTTLISVAVVLSPHIGEGEVFEGGDGPSCDPDISEDGRYISFSTKAPNLSLPGTTVYSVIRRDRDRDENGAFDELGGEKLQTYIVSRSYRTGLPDADSGASSISGDGQHIAFHSDATDVVPGDDNADRDVFAWFGGSDRRLVSGRSDFSPGNGHSEAPSLSSDGNFVAFHSDATDLVTPDANGSVLDVFLRDYSTPYDGTSMSDAEVIHGGATMGDLALALAQPDDLALLIPSAAFPGGHRVAFEATLTAEVTGSTSVRVATEHSISSVTTFVLPQATLSAWNVSTQSFDVVESRPSPLESERVVLWAEMLADDYVAADGTIRVRVDVEYTNSFQLSAWWADATLR